VTDDELNTKQQTNTKLQTYKPATEERSTELSLSL